MTVQARQLAPGILSLAQKRGGHVHAFLLEGANGALTLIDSLFDTDGRGVLAAIANLGRAPSDLRHIAVTHAHRSHLGGLAALKARTGAAVYAHGYEADVVAGQRKAQPVGFAPSRPLLRFAPTLPYQYALDLGIGAHPPCAVDEELREGMRLGPVEVLHVPGHSPGHCAFWWPERRTLFAGDAVCTWPAFADGWPAFNLNAVQHWRSLARMAELDAEVACVGHGDAITAAASERIATLVADRRPPAG